MQYKSTLKKRLLALVLMVGILVTSIGITANAAEPTQQENSITKAVDWLKANQNPDGSWGASETVFLDTSEVSDYLTKYNALDDNLQMATTWMEGLEPLNNDVAARILPFVKNADKHEQIKNSLLSSQNADGGWGIAKGYESDILDTVLVLNSLVTNTNTNTETSVMQKAVSYIISRQNSNGSWSFVGDGESITSLTAQATLALSSFQTKLNLTSSELQTAMRKAGEFLISVQKEDKTWGTDEASITDTLLAYCAVLNTVGLDAVDTVDSSILNVQSADGSWFGNPYITVLAIQAIKERMDIPNAKINSIKLFKNIDKTKTESYSFNAYETFETQADSTYSNIDAKLLYFIKQKDGSIISAQTDGLPGWNTKNSPPGDYSVIVQVKDNVSGSIVASEEKQFIINPSFEIRNVILTTEPENIRVNNPCSVSTETTLISNSNVDKTLTLKTSVIDGDTVIKEDNKTIESKSTEQITKVTSITFTPDVTTSKNYIIKTEVFEGTNKLTQGETTFNVLPPLPPTRIDASQSLNKSVLYPGNDSVTAELKISGQGTSEMPQRSPVDLVLAVDDSGSMEWGNVDNTTSKPWRIDFAKEASSHVADLLQTNDRGAVVEFAGSAWIQQNITEDKALLKTKILQTPASPWDGTAIGLGLQSANSILNTNSSDSRNKVILLLSDGGENVWSLSSVINQANIAKQKGYKIYTIGLGAGADQDLLSTLASITGGKYVYSPTMEQLDEMMTELAGDIFDTAGKNVVLESTIPVNGMNVDTAQILPAPTNIINNNDGTKTLKWTLDRLVMGQEKVFEINYEGTNLVSDTEVLLTQNTKLTYQDRNGTTVTENLPDLKIPVSKYMLDSKVVTDKTSYTANENVNITNTAQNLTNYSSTLTGKVEITDISGRVVKTITEAETSTWNANESKSIDFSWNTGSTMTGTYKAKITWSEGAKLISVAETSFDIVANAEVLGTLTVDKQKYTANEEVNISELVKNNSTNNIQNGLIVKTNITNAQGEIIWSSDNALPELLPTGQTTVKNIWNTARNAPGQYLVAMEVYKGTSNLTGSSSTFEIVPEAEGITGISGSLEVLQKTIYSGDDVSFKYIINNTGNVKLDDVTARIRMVDAASGKVIGTITDPISLDVSASYSAEKNWNHEPLSVGNYIAVLDAVMPDGKEVALGRGYFTVEKSKILLSEAFKYTLFSGSINDPLYMYINKGNINGDVHTNKAFEFSGTSLTISGILSSLGAINTWGQTIQIDQKKEDTNVIEMPDVVSEVKQIASTDANIRTTDYMVTDYGNGIDFLKSEISEGYIQVNGTSFTSKGYIVANNNVSFNLNSIKSTKEDGIVISSANGDISFSATSVDLKGIIYAPNGTVYINANTFNLVGRIIAKKIVINCSNFDVASTQNDLDLLDVSLIR